MREEVGPLARSLGATVHALVEDQISRSPASTAVVFAHAAATWSYLEIGQRSAAVAARLGAAGIIPGAIVAVCVDEQPWALLSELAVLRAGAGFVPVDPGWPPARIQHIFQDCQCTAALVAEPNARFLHLLEPLVSSIVSVTNLKQDTWSCPPVIACPDSISHVVYTSGTTGNPNGVVCEHRSLVNYMRAKAKAHAIDANSRVLVASATTWDPAIGDAFSALAAGAAVCVAPRASLVQDLAGCLRSSSATHICAAPALWSLLNVPPSSLPGLQVVALGGEAMPAAVIRTWAGAVRLLNTYGVTEACVYQTVSECVPGAASRSVGQPLDGVQVWLDTTVAGGNDSNADGGEVCLGGVQVARGYLNRPELTQRRFVQIPEAGPGTWFRTGDLGRWQRTGDLEILGRVDHQLKIRGFRVEPGGIEAVLCSSALVSSAVVVAVATDEDTRLAARGHAGPTPAVEGHAGPTPAVEGHAGPTPAVEGHAGPTPAVEGHAGPTPAVEGHAGPTPAVEGHAGPTPTEDSAEHTAAVEGAGPTQGSAAVEGAGPTEGSGVEDSGSGAPKRIVGYIVLADGVSCEAFEEGGREAVSLLCEAQLPPHEVPTEFVVLGALPLTPAGKVDRRALPRPACRQRQAQTSPQGALRTSTERAVAVAWGRALGLYPEGQGSWSLAEEHTHRYVVGPLDSFWSLGGTSLSAVEMLRLLYKLLPDGSCPSEAEHERARLCGVHRHPTLRAFCTFLDFLVAAPPSDEMGSDLPALALKPSESVERARAAAEDFRDEQQGAAALSLAASRGHSRIVSALIAAGAHPDGSAWRATGHGVSDVTDVSDVKGKAKAPERVRPKQQSQSSLEVQSTKSRRQSRRDARRERNAGSGSRTADGVGSGAGAGAGDGDAVGAGAGDGTGASAVSGAGAGVDGADGGGSADGDDGGVGVDGSFGEDGAAGRSALGRREKRKHRTVTPLMLAAEGGFADVVALLIKAKAAVNLVDEVQSSALQRAAASSAPGAADCVKVLLEQGGAAVNSRDINRWTALHAAAWTGAAESMRTLLERKAIVWSKDRWGRTALAWAVHNNHSPVVELLLAAGAEVDPEHEKNRIAPQRAHQVRANTASSGGWAPTLHLALQAPGAAADGFAVLQRLLDALHRSGPNKLRRSLTAVDTRGRTALHAACEKGAVVAVGKLIDAGSSLALRDTDGWTPLQLAEAQGHFEAVALLADAGLSTSPA